MTNDLPARFADETPITEEWLDSLWPRDPDGAQQWFLDGQMDGDGEWFLTSGARFWTIAHIGRCRLTLDYKPARGQLLLLLAALGWSGKGDTKGTNDA